MKKTITILLIAIMACALFAACTPSTPAAEAPATEAPAAEAAATDDAAGEAAADNAAADTSWDDIKAKGYFIMGLDDGFPPMGFRDEKGDIVGFDVDLARAVAEKLGVDVQLEKINWSTKELELDNGNIDVIWNGYTITPERLDKVLMSEPYMQNLQVIVVKTDSPIQALADLADKKVAVQDGSSAQGAIAANEELASSIADQVDFKDNVTAFLDVDSNQVDALAVDSVVADYYLAKKPGAYRILDETLAPEDYGIGFRKNDQAFHDALIGAFEELKADGTAAKISNEWFGRDVTAAQ